MATVNFTIDETTDVPTLLRQWEEDHHAPSYDPIPLLTRLAELIELETDNYNKMDPDPFDERHPSRADPNCALGVMLKVLFRKDSFMNKLVNDYLRENYYSRLGISRDVTKLNIIACRLMIDILPGLETSAVFESPTNDALVQRLFGWAEKSSEPMQTYATGLLAAAMEVQDIAAGFREQNARLVPLMLERLHLIHKEAIKDRHCSNSRPFAHLNSLENGLCESTPKKKPYHHGLRKSPVRSSLSPPPPLDDCAREVAETQMKNGPRKPPEPELRRKSVEAWEPRSPHRPGLMSPPLPRPSPFHVSDCSNSSWAELEPFVIGNVQMFPPTWATRQYFILKYLTPMGEYQEFLSHVFEKNALELILQIMNLRESKNSRLSFEALKYLASLLCHKKFSIEFINMQGLQRLLEVPRPSIAATGVSICLYYLAYCEDAMERVCLLPHHILSDLVSYALWLLECSHDSGRCHATMFFGLSFQFRIILEEFDAQDGLRKLYNVMSTLPILAVEDDAALNEDEECSARQIVRHVCVALKRYLEAHLHIKAEQLRRTHMRDNTNVKMPAALPSYKAMKSSSEEVQEQITSVLELMSFRAQWQPVDELMRLGGITLLLQVIAFAYEWNYSGRAETVRSALEVLCMCAVMPRVQLQLCERVDLPDEAMTVGVNVILGAAEGEIVQDPDVQRAALAVLICCVCAPIHRVGGMVAKFSSTGSAKKRTQNVRSSEEVIEKLWDCVRSNNGIMVLLTLMMVKTPITDADSIRGLACYALVGLARSETVRQIISKLSLFTNGQLQNLMRDPILQDKRQEHVIFQKYALELLERVSGKSKPSGNELEVSLQNIHRANVIAQTHINFNERQLFQLIQQHLVSHGMVESAAVLQQEANLPVLKPPTSSPLPAPFSYKQLSNSHSTTPVRGRSSLLSPHPLPLQRVMVASIQTSDLASPSTSPLGAGYSVRGQSTPLKLSLSRKPETKLIPTSSRSLQKQISYDGTPVMPAALAQSTMPLLKECHVTLDSIITEYLTNQHALCKNPMVTCPQFNLFVPHKCPDPKTRNAIPTNFCMRLMKGSVSRKLNNRLVHSRFCPVKTFRLGDDDAFFTCCEFGRDRQLIVGTHHGEIKMFNLLSGVEEATFQCHDSYISGLQANQDGTLLLSSATWRRPLSVLWGVTNLIEQKFAMDEEDYVEFSKLTQDRVIGTKNEHATIYDAATGKKVLTLTPSLSNQYSKNRATFNPTDELVLSDGVLWDVSSAKQIHKFDKLNQTLSGVFHPNGLEVISNTEVWDLRTFHLLRTVPSLDKCEVQFNRFGSIIYAISMEQEMEEDSSYESSYKTLDATDYANIATMDVKKNIYDLAMNRVDTQIAIVENQGTYDSVQESIVRLYDVGRRRDDEDEVEDEDEEEELDGSDDGSEIDNSDDEIVDVTEENSQNLQNLLDEIARDVDELNDELQGNPDAPDAEERNDDDSASSLDLMDDSSTDDMEVNIEGSDSSGES